MRTMMKSKIHRAHITETNLNYEGSISIDDKLMKSADILPYEQVHVLNVNNGSRFETYAIAGKEGEVRLNGAAARLGEKGDVVIILTYCGVEEKKVAEHVPRIIHVDEKNRVLMEALRS